MTKLADTQRGILSKAAQHEALLAEPPKHLPAAARQSVLRSLMVKGLLEEIPVPRDHLGLAWRQDEDGVQFGLRITPVGLAAIGVEPPQHQPEGDHEAPPQPAAAALFPTAGQGDSQAAVLSPPLSAASETPEGPQRAGTGRVTALRVVAARVVAAWDTPERVGLDEAVVAMRDAFTSKATRPTRDPAASRAPRTGTKQEAVLALLRRDEGATIADIINATGWQQHTVRGFLAGLKRRSITVEVLERVRQVGPNKQGAKGSYSIYRIATAVPAEAC